MAIKKKVDFIKCLSTMVSNISSSITDKFTRFYSKRIFDIDLAPSKTFAYDFALGASSNAPHRKSLEKLKGLFTKYLAKINPALQLTVNDFISMGQSNGAMIMNLFTIQYNETLPEYDENHMLKLMTSNGFSKDRPLVVNKATIITDSTVENMYFNSLPEIMKINRYLKYLNYLARKHDVPVKLSIDRINSWEGDNTKVSGSTKVIVVLTFVGWYCPDALKFSRYAVVRATGKPDDELFSNPMYWNDSMLNSFGGSGETYGFHISKFFVHLDKVLNVLNTLTRKVEYGYSAFTFRT